MHYQRISLLERRSSLEWSERIERFSSSRRVEPDTFTAEVVHEDDLEKEAIRRAAVDAVNRTKQRRPVLVVKRNADANVRQPFEVLFRFTAIQLSV